MKMIYRDLIIAALIDLALWGLLVVGLVWIFW